ncbi:MAG: hypothetical protein LBR38_10050 [Synergistaceae bacterium]|jgi:hypothetical protein|nr:hypothetical protein [Synergistaceae bacterium]
MLLLGKGKQGWFALAVAALVVSFVVVAGGWGCGGDDDGGSSSDTPNFAALEGEWNITGGSGTATANGATYELTAVSGDLAFSLQQETPDYELFNLKGQSSGFAIINGNAVPVTMYSHAGEQVKVTYSDGTYRGTAVESNAEFALKFSSDTSAEVSQTGVSDAGYQYTVKYTLQKVPAGS